jgi:tetrahydromethanopterin S-methyltransferase subunit F
VETLRVLAQGEGFSGLTSTEVMGALALGFLITLFLVGRWLLG